MTSTGYSLSLSLSLYVRYEEVRLGQRGVAGWVRQVSRGSKEQCSWVGKCSWGGEFSWNSSPGV